MTDQPTPLKSGDPAPSLTLPAVNRDGPVSLGDFRPRSAVLLGLFRGLHCPFCRRQVFQLGGLQPTLRELGVETIAVLNTQPDRARMYFRYHPTPLVVLADAEAVSHRAFALPSPPLDAQVMQALSAVRINPTGELPQAMPPMEANSALNARDGFEPNETDQAIVRGNPAQLVGHFLIDREGIVRWTSVEAAQGLEGIGTFPTPVEILAAARSLGSARHGDTAA